MSPMKQQAILRDRWLVKSLAQGDLLAQALSP
jgi:hypothetical protein